MWKDKKPMLLICIHANPIELPAIQYPLSVPRNDGDPCNYINLSQVHYEYTTYIHGVDAVDQLQASYLCQSRSHKWWHRIIKFLLDQTKVNMYILYLSQLKCQRLHVASISYL